MKILSYRGAAHVREISSDDIKRAWGIEAAGISVDARVSRLVTVSNKVAEKLIATGEFAEAGDVADVGDDSSAIESAVPAAEGETPSIVSVKEDHPPRDTDVTTESSQAPAEPRRIKDQPQA